MAVLPGEKQLTAALPIELVERFRLAVKEGPDSKLIVKALIKLWFELPESDRFGIAFEKGSILARLRKLPDTLESQIVDSGLHEAAQGKKKGRSSSKSG